MEYNRLTVSETVLIDEPDDRYMEMLKFGQRTLNCSGIQKRYGRLFGDDDAMNQPEAEGIRNSGIV